MPDSTKTLQNFDETCEFSRSKLNFIVGTVFDVIIDLQIPVVIISYAVVQLKINDDIL